MWQYILETIVFQALFLLLYDFLLKKETFFNWNRTYLLATSVLSLLLPFVKIDRLRRVVPEEFVISMPEIVLGNSRATSPTGVDLTAFEAVVPSYGLIDYVWFTGLLLAFMVFFKKLYGILSLIRGNSLHRQDGVRIVKLQDSHKAFSFFNFVFLGENIQYQKRDAILKHELVHVKQRHSWDLLYFEILRVVFWFNPLVYIYQSRISVLHEYTADAESVVDLQLKSYYQELLSQVFDTHNVSFVNTFFKQSLIKKRIEMLSKTRSNQANSMKYLLLFPIMLGMVIYTSCGDETLKKDDMELTETISERSELIAKVEAIKEQVQVQGNVAENEQMGLDLLLKAVSGSELDQQLVVAIQDYTSDENQSTLKKRISDVFEQLQVQGNISNDEEKALKTLLALTTENGLNNSALQEIVEFVEVPFGVIDQPPVFPGCEGLSLEEQRACFVEKVTQHVMKNFNAKVANGKNLSDKQRIVTAFSIDPKGKVSKIKVNAKSEVLKNESLRVLNTLPRMTPGKQDGKAVNVVFSLPILFEMED